MLIVLDLAVDGKIAWGFEIPKKEIGYKKTSAQIVTQKQLKAMKTN